MRKYIYILFGLLFFQSCKKDKLTGEKEVLVGEWGWIYTDYYFDYCNPPSSSKVLTPISENTSYDLLFSQNGKMEINKEGKLLEKGRIVFTEWDNHLYNLNYYTFNIQLNNKEDNIIYGNVSNDTLILIRSYFFENDNSCYDANGGWCCRNICYYVRK